MDTTELLALLDGAFADDGWAARGWPDPHPAGAGPREEEYSRLLNPGKYRALGGRMDAWACVLAELGAATSEEVAVSQDLWRRSPSPLITRTTRLTAAVPGAQPLLVGRTRLGDVDHCGLCLGVGDPAVPAGLIPDCGCDACDDGSASLLRWLDDVLLGVLDGSFMHVSDGSTRSVTVRRLGWEASNFRLGGDATTWLADARAGRSPYDLVAGAAWIEGLT